MRVRHAELEALLSAGPVLYGQFVMMHGAVGFERGPRQRALRRGPRACRLRERRFDELRGVHPHDVGHAVGYGVLIELAGCAREIVAVIDEEIVKRGLR